MRALTLGCVALAACCLGGARASQAQTGTVSRVTYFQESGYMADGVWTYDGAAACGYAIPLGATVRIIGPDVYLVCEDRGYLGATQVDVFSPYGRPVWLQADFYPVEWF